MAKDLGESLSTLKDNLQSATDLMAPWGQFHDDFAEIREYTSAAEVRRNDVIEKGLAAIAGELFDETGPLRRVRLLHLKEHGFWHGSAQIGEWTAVCFFFEETGQGLAGFFKKITDMRVELTRMTMTVVPEDSRPDRRGSFVSWSRRVNRARA